MARTQQETTQKRGRDFENRVRSTLVAAGYRVSSEQLQKHKKVDLIARQWRLGSEWTIAVECKKHHRPVGKALILEIWADHEPLYQRGDVDEVLVVSSAGFTAAAATYIRERRGLAGQSFDELLNSIMDFGSYLVALIDAYDSSSDGIKQYYQRPQLPGGDDLESLVMRWIHEQSAPSSENGPPTSRRLAILGAYGIGKSSFATHLSASLAQRALADGDCRIPLLVRLGDIGGEQSLEGLMGKHFTTHHAVPGYSFDAFMLLNRRGRFVTIFDGFDEMKQMLNWRELRYNLRELNRLHDGNSRLILLGRPTAFESDEEHREALHGKGHRRGQTLDGKGHRGEQRPDWPDYSELLIDQFQPAQVKNFLKDYLKYRRASIASSPYDFDYLWDQVRSKHLRDISRRPVQLRMLAEILPDYQGDVASLTIATVYQLSISRLIDQVIRREEDKQGRLAFSKHQRREFFRDFAFWHWTTDDPLVTTYDLPVEIVRKYALGEENLERARRDLISGSPLDRSLGDRIRFPHRSLQEYLVAEELWVRLKKKNAPTLDFVDGLMNDEVAEFFGRQMQPGDAGRVLKALPQFRGPLHWRTAQALFIDTPLEQLLKEKFDAAKHGRKPEPPSPWELLGLLISSEFGSASGRNVTRLVSILGSTSKLGQESLLSLFGTLVALHKTSRTALHGIASDTITHLINDEMSEPMGVEGSEFIERLGKTLVFNRKGQGQLGLIIEGSGVRLGPGGAPIAAGDLEVHWLPDYAVMIARRLAFSRDHSECHVGALRRVFADRLSDYAFVKEWLTSASQGYETVSSDVELATVIKGSRGQFKDLRELCSAISHGVDQAIELRFLSESRAALFAAD